jgi:cardiolipin synthase
MPLIHHPFRGRTNLRNHRKITVVDNRTVLAGGANIGIEYMSPQSYDGRWKDLAFTLEGPAVRHWLNVFARDWQFAAKEEIPEPELKIPDCDHPGDGIVQVVPSGPDVAADALHDALLSIVYAAQKRLWVVTPYFVPDDALAQALTLAARRGVDVRILLPRRSNHRLPDIVRGNPLRQIQNAGGLVMFYTPRMLHAKVLLADNVALLGSANMDVRSLLLNYETAMCLYSHNDIKQVETYIEQLSIKTQCGIAPATLPRALGESIIRLISPLL